MAFLPTGGNAAAKSFVDPTKKYTYTQLGKDIKELQQQYPDLVKVKTIGKSEYGRNIYAVSLGKGSAKVFINGSHHAREWMTTSLNMELIDQYAAAYKGNKKIGGYNVRSLLNSSTLWFVPMVNPDGVTLQQQGLNAFPKSTHSSLIKMNKGSKNFKRWKANAKGIDLNRQYNAGWSAIKNSPKSPSYKNYKGKTPESAKEVKAIISFVNQINPEMAIAYHSSGEVLYWNYKQSAANKKRDLIYAKKIGSMTGYSLVYPGPNPSGGGFTDWFISKKKKPGFTPEIGKYVVETELPLSAFSRVWSQNKAVSLYAAQESIKLKDARDKKAADAVKKDSTAKKKNAAKLKSYYATNIKKTADLKITSAHQKLYNTVTKDIAALEKKVKSLPSKYTKGIKADINDMKTHQKRSLAFQNAVKEGAILQKNQTAMINYMKAGKADTNINSKYNTLNKSITTMEKKIGAVYTAEVRSLFKTKYITPAVNTRMNNQYEKDRVNLLIVMEKQVKEKKYEEAKKNLDSLKVMEDKSKKLKADSKRYPTYKTYEASLNTWKQKLIKQIEAALSPAPEPAPETEKELEAEPELLKEPAEEPLAAETAEPNQAEENPAVETPAEMDTSITQ
ncbi:peptidase M14 [Pradoshia eiseniae]|uniref:Peptidase M14 n=2 Tax=Pradoshia eiseniae TaxID=2064768 RepID=A0A2S7N2K0_9BACI|nr:peptidase M14 [Pradoshia eiseniae]